MKLCIHSDLHNEYRKEKIIPIAPEADVMIFAGDITSGSQTPEYYRKVAKANPKAKILFVLGNHEHYGSCVEDIVELNRESFNGHEQIHFLENNHIEIGGVEFVGATLWSNFSLAKSPEQITLIESRIADFFKIRYGSRRGLIRAKGGMKSMYVDSYRYISSRLMNSQAKKRVVITHFSPHVQLGHVDYPDSDFAPYFIADCEDLFSYSPDLWIYGHTHCNKFAGSYIDGVRIEINCCGYESEQTGYKSDHLITL